MPSLCVASDRAEILRRLGRLTPETRPGWGGLTAPRLLCHLADQLRVAMGEISVVPTDTLLSRTLLKWLVVYTPLKAPPGKVKAPPEMLRSSPGGWASDLERCRGLIGRVGTAPVSAVHPTFGRLTPDGWGRLGWKHLDHHLRQFGL